MSTKTRRALKTIKERILLTQEFIHCFYQPICVIWKRNKRQTLLVILITCAMSFVSFAVFGSPLVHNRPNNINNTMSKNRDYYIECNQSSEWMPKNIFEYFKYMATFMFKTTYPGVDKYTQYTMIKSNLKPLFGVKPLRPEFGSVFNDVAAFQYPLGIQPCRYNNGSNNLFVAIISAVGNFKERESIRQTWLQTFHQNQSSNNSFPVRISGYGFITGQTKNQNVSIRIGEESKTHGDILQINFIDDYYNLTVKVAGLVNWLNSYCSQVDFVFKVDDDVFVNVRNLKAFISKTLNRSEQIIFGANTVHGPSRDGKWKISFEDWPWSHYPNFPAGGSVLLPGIAIGPLLAAVQTTPYLPFDDAYLLGLCREKAGIIVQECERCFAWREGKLGQCDVYNYISWLMPKEMTMNDSYKMTEDFYSNVTQCTIVDSKRGNPIANPYDYIFKMN